MGPAWDSRASHLKFGVRVHPRAWPGALEPIPGEGRRAAWPGAGEVANHQRQDLYLTCPSGSSSSADICATAAAAAAAAATALLPPPPLGEMARAPSQHPAALQKAGRSCPD